ncbi:MAG: DUF2231 domain-containing protein [Terriglobales bacterium]
MLNPFDLRTIFLAKHAQHVVLIHFPIALFVTGVGLDMLSRGNRDSHFAAAAYWNLSIAAAAIIPTVLTGWLAWHFVLEDQKVKGLLLLHILAASSATLLVIASWWLHWRTLKSAAPLPGYRIPLELLGVILIGLTAHLGGFLSGVNS